MKKLFLLATACCFGLLPSSADSQGEFFYRYQWACLTVEANQRAEEAMGNMDEDAFEDTGCVSLTPETEFRILRCDENVPEKYLEKFGYPIPYTTELPRIMCEMAVDTGDGAPRNLLADFPTLLLLKPRQSP